MVLVPVVLFAIVMFAAPYLLIEFGFFVRSQRQQGSEISVESIDDFLTASAVISSITGGLGCFVVWTIGRDFAVAFSSGFFTQMYTVYWVESGGLKVLAISTQNWPVRTKTCLIMHRLEVADINPVVSGWIEQKVREHGVMDLELFADAVHQYAMCGEPEFFTLYVYDERERTVIGLVAEVLSRVVIDDLDDQELVNERILKLKAISTDKPHPV